MKITEKASSRTKEKYTKIEFDNGLICFIIPKNHSASYATFAVNFGSCDTKYISEDGKIKTFPSGTAHFLEHKMFDTKQGDAMEQYALYGGDANAYTAGDRTCYLFSATDMFTENLRVLLNHVVNAYITEKSVKKEKGIIIQEIKMYDDNPRWRVRYNMMRCLYGKNSVSDDPAGTVDSVSGITKEILDDCRETAYNLRNMTLCVCGNVDTDSVIGAVNELLKDVPHVKYSRIDADLGESIVSGYSEAVMDVSLPVYSIGLKFPVPSKTEGMKEFAAVELIMDLLFGKSSGFYSECYDAGLFEEMSDSYQTMRNAFLAEISGISKQPGVLCAKIKEQIDKLKTEGFDLTAFERAKKSLYADTICDYDSVEDIADTFVSFYFEGDDMLDYPDIVADVTKEYTEDCLRRLFDIKNICLSVILPKENEK